MNIYLSPEAIEVAKDVYLSKWRKDTSMLDAVEASLSAAIQHIVENPRELSEADKAAMSGLGPQEKFAVCLRLAFTPPTPDVPKEIVELIDGFKKTVYSFDDIRDFAVKCFEAGMAVAK